MNEPGVTSSFGLELASLPPIYIFMYMNKLSLAALGLGLIDIANLIKLSLSEDFNQFKLSKDQLVQLQLFSQVKLKLEPVPA